MNITRETLSDPNSPDFDVIHVDSDAVEYYEKRASEAITRIIAANGFQEGVASWFGSAAAHTELADQEGLPMRFTIHNSPNVKGTAYGLSYKTERFERLVTRESQDGDLPVSLTSHSQGHKQLVPVGLRMLGRGWQLESAISNNPNGLTPEEVTLRGMCRAVMAGRRELSPQNATEARYPSTALFEAVPDLKVLSMEQKIASYIRHDPLAAAKDLLGLLSEECVEDTVALHQKLAADGISRMRIHAGKRDGVCPSPLMRKNLADAGYPEEDFIELDTTHGGVLEDPRFAPVLYRAILLQDRRLSDIDNVTADTEAAY